MGRIRIVGEGETKEFRANLWPGWGMALSSVILLGGIATLLTWMISSFLAVLGLNFASVLVLPFGSSGWGWGRWLVGNLLFCVAFPTMVLIDGVAVFYFTYVMLAGLFIQRLVRKDAELVSTLSLFGCALATRRWRLADCAPEIEGGDSSTTTYENYKIQAGPRQMAVKHRCMLDKLTSRSDAELLVATIRAWQHQPVDAPPNGNRWQ